MATGPSYRVAFRRRREGKTDYQQRRNLVLSGLPRIIVRGSLRNFSVQVVKAKVDGDKIIVSAHTDELAKKYGWQGGKGNVPAAYLTGLLCAYKALANNVKQAVLDIGLNAPSKGSRVFAALKGALDAGVAIPHDKNKLPDEKRLQGTHVSEYGKQLSSTPEVYQRQFREQSSKGMRPEELTEHFFQVKQKISSSFQKIEISKEKKEEKPREEVAEKKPPRAVAAKKTVKPRVKKRGEPEKSEEKK